MLPALPLKLPAGTQHLVPIQILLDERVALLQDELPVPGLLHCSLLRHHRRQHVLPSNLHQVHQLPFNADQSKRRTHLLTLHSLVALHSIYDRLLCYELPVSVSFPHCYISWRLLATFWQSSPGYICCRVSLPHCDNHHQVTFSVEFPCHIVTIITRLHLL